MDRLGVWSGTFAAVVSLVGCTGPQKLVTPPLYLKDANILYCTAVNLHRTEKRVDIRVFDERGTSRCGAGPYTLLPGQTAHQVCNSDLHMEPQPVRYCVFTYDGEYGMVVGGAQIDPPKGEAVPALPVPAGSAP
jgi:hypothetical protein